MLFFLLLICTYLTDSHDYTQHNKQIACLHADLVIESSLPPQLKHGIFQTPGKKFPMYIRLSGSDPEIPDSSLEPRGMAIKIAGVEGERLLGDESCTEGNSQTIVLLG